jgi:hypothetical protein
VIRIETVHFLVDRQNLLAAAGTLRLDHGWLEDFEE